MRPRKPESLLRAVGRAYWASRNAALFRALIGRVSVSTDILRWA
jgi:hypothetical protein